MTSCTDCLPADQHFLLLFLENAGTDLESYRFDKTCGWRQATEVLWQVADSLATAEEKAEFEVCCSRPWSLGGAYMALATAPRSA